jgi:NAD(P)-dependent dehydrogenase (short-subunit alcohol dehydrogenase family)
MFESNLLKNKNIIVTGGGSGLGKSMARRFGELGANVVIFGRRKDILKATESEFKNLGINILSVDGDVRNPEDIQNLLDTAKKELGSVNGLLNNAAGNFISPTEMLSQNGFKSIVDIVLMGTWNCTSIIGKEMIDNNGGTILNIVTTYAWTGSPFVVPSACAKAGVLAMTRSLAVEWGKFNIRFNAIAPGPFPTKGAWSRLMPPGFEEFENSMKEKIPMKRFGERHELENLASYLMSDGSGYINGEVVTIDGGEWLAGAGEFSDLAKIPYSLWEEMSKNRKEKK